MKQIFRGPMAAELQAFIQFKRSLGYGYMRAEFTLQGSIAFSSNTRPRTVTGNWIAL